MNIRENLLGLILERSGALKKEQVQAVLHEQQRLKEGRILEVVPYSPQRVRVASIA